MEKRPYLSKDDRKRMLLDVAAEIVEKEGWSALSMSSLAEAAKTSRQLVYLHFSNLEQLLSSTAWHIFNDTMQGTRASIESHEDDLRAAISMAEAITLDLPPGRGDALWSLIAGTAGSSEELGKMRVGIRSLLTAAWSPPVRKELGFSAKDGAAYSWMVIMAFWGMRQMIRDGQISRRRGMELFNELADRALKKK